MPINKLTFHRNVFASCTLLPWAHFCTIFSPLYYYSNVHFHPYTAFKHRYDTPLKSVMCANSFVILLKILCAVLSMCLESDTKIFFNMANY